jgi:transcriptional regulator with XRE-family HTH domain
MKGVFMYNNIGLLIKKERENAGLSQKELAIKSGYNNYQTLLKIEKGDRNITISDLYKISNALNLNIDYFMEYDKKKEIKRKRNLFYGVNVKIGIKVKCTKINLNHILKIINI